MVCRICGKEVPAGTKFCPVCGAQLTDDVEAVAAQAQAQYQQQATQSQYQQQSQPQYQQPPQQQAQPQYQQPPQQQFNQTAPKNANNTFGLIGFILSFFGGVLGLIFSIIGVVKRKEYTSGNGLAIAGLVLSIISMVVYIIYISAVIAAIGAAGAMGY